MHIIKEVLASRKQIRSQMKVYIAGKYLLKTGGNVLHEDIRDVTILGICTVENAEGKCEELEFGTIKYAGQKIKVVGFPSKGYIAVTNLGKY